MLQGLGLILLAGDLVLGQLQDLKTYDTSFGTLTAVHWGLDSEVHHLGDLEFEFRGDDAALEFVFDPPYLGGLAGLVEVRTGEEYWIWGGAGQQMYLDEVGTHEVETVWTMDELLVDWVAPEDLESPVSSRLHLKPAASNVPEPQAWQLCLVMTVMAFLGVAFARLW